MDRTFPSLYLNENNSDLLIALMSTPVWVSWPLRLALQTLLYIFTYACVCVYIYVCVCVCVCVCVYHYHRNKYSFTLLSSSDSACFTR